MSRRVGRAMTSELRGLVRSVQYDLDRLRNRRPPTDDVTPPAGPGEPDTVSILPGITETPAPRSRVARTFAAAGLSMLLLGGVAGAFYVVRGSINALVRSDQEASAPLPRHAGDQPTDPDPTITTSPGGPGAAPVIGEVKVRGSRTPSAGTPTAGPAPGPSPAPSPSPAGPASPTAPPASPTTPPASPTPDPDPSPTPSASPDPEPSATPPTDVVTARLAWNHSGR